MAGMYHWGGISKTDLEGSHATGAGTGDEQGKPSGLLQHEGKYVLIHGESVVDVFATYQDALRQGYRQFGLEPFMAKQILSTERIHFVTRAIEPVVG